MADQKITQLTDISEKDDDDVLAIVDDPSGSPTTKKVKAGELRRAPICMLAKTTAGNQNVGGAAGTEVWWTWETQVKVDTEFAHDTGSNPSRITVNKAGTYRIRLLGNVQQTGAARTTITGIYRINGGTTRMYGTVRDYTRGSSYGNCSPGLEYIVELSASDYIEVGTKITDTDATYTLYNCDGTEVGEGESVVIIEKVG